MTGSDQHHSRWAWAEVDLDAIAHNVGQLRVAVAPAEVWAVVKADGYGHGAVEVGRASLTAGAAGLCVALVSEGVELRRAGIDAPVLVLSEQPAETFGDLIAHDLIATVSTADGIDRLAAAVVDTGGATCRVHLKIDTGMHRVGARPDEVASLVARIDEHPQALVLDGVFTHLAVADEVSNPYTQDQLDRFDAALGLSVDRRHRRRPRRQLGRRVDPAGCPAVAGSRRDRGVRHLPGSRTRRAHRVVAPGDGAEGTGRPRQAAERR